VALRSPYVASLLETATHSRVVFVLDERAKNVADVAAITHLPTSANEVLVAVREISHALLEQSQASSDIARHVEKIAQMAQENSGAIDQTKESAQSLRCLAGTLQTSVMRFAV
jgi:methyl-accepting chemotaxis protein